MTDSTSRHHERTQGGASPAARFPRARSNGILLERLDDETLVYDLATHEAHCLNRAAALVWDRSDGETSLETLAGLLPEVDLPPRVDLVRLALDDLEKAGLLAEYQAPSSKQAVSRREIVRALGAAAGMTLVFPAVSSVVAPLAAQAASCLTQTQCQNKGKKDCSGLPICGAPGFCCGPAGKKGCNAIPC
jgi:hypothetical protein